jgi:cation diffusion facilitator family transporter
MEESRTAVGAALLGNAALAALKGISAVATGSAAMVAETFHSIADTGNQALLFLGMRLARQPPDTRHPFGYGKDVYFWSFVVAVMLFSLGGAFSIWEAVRKFLAPAPHARTEWAYAVLAGAFVFESLSIGVAIHSLLSAKGPRSLREYWRDSRDPTLLTVLLEDSAALLSLVIAAIGIGLSHLTGHLLWDAAASAVIGIVLVGVAVVLAFESHSLLLGESAPRDVEDAIRRVAEDDDAVVRVRQLHTMHLGPVTLLVVLGIEFHRGLATEQVEAAVGRLQHQIQDVLRGRTTRRLVVIEPEGGADAVSRRAA